MFGSIFFPTFIHRLKFYFLLSQSGTLLGNKAFVGVSVWAQSSSRRMTPYFWRVWKTSECPGKGRSPTQSLCDQEQEYQTGSQRPRAMPEGPKLTMVSLIIVEFDDKGFFHFQTSFSTSSIRCSIFFQQIPFLFPQARVN